MIDDRQEDLNVAFGLRFQSVDATQALILSTGVSKSNVSRGRSLGRRIGPHAMDLKSDTRSSYYVLNSFNVDGGLPGLDRRILDDDRPRRILEELFIFSENVLEFIKVSAGAQAQIGTGLFL